MISPYFNLSGSDARGLLYGLMETDKIQLREHPEMPSVRKLIQQGKIRYKRADPNEHWQSYKEIVDQTKYGGTAYADCEDLASALAAEDQVRYGVKSIPYAYTPREGLFHVVTAVPKGQFGALPNQSWPDAKGAPPLPGYILQDPSEAAGMSTFGGLPGKEGMMSNSYGALRAPAPRRRRGLGLGGVLSALKKGLIGEDKAIEAAFQLGSGAREGVGVQKGWASDLGRQLGGRFGPGAPSEGEQEAAAISALQKGAKAEADQTMADEDAFLDDEGLGDDTFGFDGSFGRMWFADDPDLEFDEEFEEEEEFGELVGSPSWGMSALTDRVTDDMFGLNDDLDDEFGALDDDEDTYSMGIFGEHVDGFHDDLHEDVGPRPHYGADRFTPPEHMHPPSHMRGPLDAPMVSFGGQGDDDEYGILGIAIGKKARRKKQNRKIARHLPKLEQVVAKGNERRAMRIAKRIYKEVSKLQKLGTRPLAGNKKLRAAYNFGRGKIDFDTLTDRFDKFSSYGILSRGDLFGQIDAAVEDAVDEEMGFDEDFGFDDEDLL